MAIIAIKRMVVVVLLAANLSAQLQAPHSRPGWPCVAGRAVDPSYVSVAEATGGQVFLFDRSEAARSMVLVVNSRKHEDTIFRSMGTLATGTREFTFPVDTTVESLMLTVTLQCLQSITVSRPSNPEVREGEPDTDTNRFKSGLILILTRPEAGEWRVRIAGTGMFFVVARAKSSISLGSVEFVEPGGRPGHEGLFKVKGPLHMGEQRMLSANVSGTTSETAFRLVDSAGETLEPIELNRDHESGDDQTFLGTLKLTHPAFRLLVQGRDPGGLPFQRILPSLFQVQSAP